MSTQTDSHLNDSESQHPSNSEFQDPSKEVEPTPRLPMPPPYLPQRQISPMKTPLSYQIPPPQTPSIPITPAPLHLKDTPLSNQDIQRSGNYSHISATAITPSEKGDSPVRRKHRRDKHVGPIVPKFGRKERTMKIDLEIILSRDRKRFWLRAMEGKLQRGNSEGKKKETGGEVAEEEDMAEIEAGLFSVGLF